MKTLCMLVLAAAFATVTVGCRGSAEVDVDESTPIAAPR